MKATLIRLNKIKKKNQKIFYQRVDISNKKKVDDFVKRSIEKLNQIHVLINNAGIYGPKGKSDEVNWNNWIKAIQTNLFGSILISRGIIKHFKKNNYGKIIQLSGGGVAGPLPFMSAYGTSKIAITRYMQCISEELKEYDICVNTVAPGAINTDMLKEIISDGPKNIGHHHYKKALFQKKRGGTGYKKAIDLILFLSSDESRHIRGKIIHSLWDDWKKLSKHSDSLNNSDIYTLKRINPIDRGFKWGGVKKKIIFDKLFGPYKKS